MASQSIDMLFIEKERIGGIGTFHIIINPPSVQFKNGLLRFNAQTYSYFNYEGFIRAGTFTQPHWNTGGAHLGATQRDMEERKRAMRR